jgi:putative transposase
VAVGVTMSREEVLFGVVPTATENRKVCPGFLRELVERGLRIDAGLLVVTDGAKGLQVAVREVFGAPGVAAAVHKVHKMRNVCSITYENASGRGPKRSCDGPYQSPDVRTATRLLQDLARHLEKESAGWHQCSG